MSDPDTLPQNGIAFAEYYRGYLLNDVLPFWFPRCLDQDHGGYLTSFDRDGALVDSDKSVWAQGRMSWMLLTMCRSLEDRSDWHAWADSGLHFLADHCFDSAGRMYFHMTREGQPVRQRRYAFSEAFAAQAWAMQARWNGGADSPSARRALHLYEQFMHWHFTPGVMPPKFTDVRPMVSLGPYMIALGTAQELREALGERPDLTRHVDWCLEEIQRLFLKAEHRVLLETVGVDGRVLDHFDGRTLNPGHALECAWFILREGNHRGDSHLIRMGCDIVEWMWERGWDREYGGLFYFCDLEGKPVLEYWHDMKFWWPHCEAIIATLMAWKLTGNAQYARWHRLVHDWSFDRFGDREHGEWFGYLHRDGSLSTSLKGNLWKSFYHLPRMLWWGWQLSSDGN